MSILGIKVYYSDGACCSTKERPLETFERDYVQVVNVYHSTGVHTLASHEFYWVDPANWANYGRTNRPEEIPEGAIQFRGHLIDKPAFTEIYNRAYADKEL